MTEGSTHRPLRVVFVCLGNICRSPIAERVAERAAAEAGITGVEFSSAGTISEEYDDPMDHRAAAILKEHGYRHADHKARRITEIRDRVSRPGSGDGGRSPPWCPGSRT